MSAAEFKRLHGRAIPFNKTIALKDGLFEMVESKAFDRFLEAPLNDVNLLEFFHDGRVIASTADRSLRLFADSRGLNFYADIDASYGHENWHLLRAMRRSKPADQCSVNFNSMACISDVYLGAHRQRIVRARIDHIAVGVTGGAYGAATGVWTDGDEKDPASPLRIQEMAGEFQDGAATWPLREFIRRR